MRDLNGRAYARLSDCKPGTKLQADDGFDYNTREYLVGLYPVPEPTP